ncbi:MAG TPA: hypothetical protein VFR81_22700 [Longimicrobium sp.]|nr:hypothetical protein [Longimicrobium sp.]
MLSWREIPVSELRSFVAELVRDSNLREAARLIGRGREQVRKFVSGDIENPHPSTREAIAKLYQQRHGTGTGLARDVHATAVTRTPLRLILPRPVEKATAEIRAVFDVIRRHADEAPETAAALEKWLLTHIKDEYAVEIPYPQPRKRKPRKAKGAPDADGSEGG